MSDNVVVARVASGHIVISCNDLARVSDLTCPLPTEGEDAKMNRAVDLFTLPYPGTTSADHVFQPRGIVEPGPDAGALPIQTLFVPTDGSVAAQERIRTLAAAIPISRSKVAKDIDRGVSVAALETVLPYAMVFVLLVAACSLTISVINGVLERRRPFALLRASGMRLGELRTIVMIETGVPLALSLLGGVGLALLTNYAAAPPHQWLLPSGSFVVGLAIGALVAFAVSLIALPFMSVATRHDGIRFE
jgi:hypothetical protein